MTYNKQLVIMPLALVMVLGFVPLGFADSLKVQLERGIETNEIQCDNLDHVLVFRTNENLACVTERTAEKMGWQIINDDSPKIITEKYEPENNLEDVSLGYDYHHLFYHPEIEYTYPEEFELGVPFDIKYTIEYSEPAKSKHGYPDEILDSTISILLNPAFDIGADGFELQPNDGLSIYDRYFKEFVFDNTKTHTGTITLTIDEKIEYPYNTISIVVDIDSSKPFAVYMDGNTGYIKTDGKPMVFQSEHNDYQQEIGLITLQSDEPMTYSSPFNEFCTEKYNWDELSADEQLWHIKYKSCNETDPSKEHEFDPNQTVATDQQIVNLMRMTLEELNVTSGYREFLEDPDNAWLNYTPEDIQNFFDSYPELDY